MLTDISPGKQPPSSLIQAKNVVFSNGNVQKAPGGLRWNETSIGTGIVAAHYWQPTLELERFIVVGENGSIYRGQDRQFNITANTSVASVLTPNCMFAECGSEDANNPKKLVLFTDGATLPYVLNGDSTAFATIATPNENWTSTGTFPKFGLVHRGSLWAFAGQFSYASSTSDHEDFSNSSAVLVESVYPGEGGELRGGAVFKGRLFAFKDGGFVYMLNDTNASAANWYWEKLGSNFGLAAPNAIAEVLNDLFAGNTSGTINSYAASEKLGNVEAGDIVQELGFESHLRGNTNKVGVSQQHLFYYGEKKQLFATYRSGYFTYNDMLLCFDFGRPGQIRPSYLIKGSPQCLAEYRDVNKVRRPMYGDKDGYLVLMDREDRTEGGSAYTGAFQTPHYDFSWLGPQMASAEKHFDFLAVHYIPESSGDLSCDYFIDGRFIETLTFPMIQYTAPKLGSLILGTDRLVQPNTETGIRQLKGTGRTISFYFYQAGSNQSFQVPAITVMFRGGGDKAQQT